MHYNSEWDAETADQVCLHEFQHLDSINHTTHNSMYISTIT